MWAYGWTNDTSVSTFPSCFTTTNCPRSRIEVKPTALPFLLTQIPERTTLTLKSRRAMVMTHIYTCNTQMSKLAGSKATVDCGNCQTADGRTFPLTWSATTQNKSVLSLVPRLLTRRYPHLLLSALRRVPAIDRSLLQAPALSSKPAACR